MIGLVNPVPGPVVHWMLPTHRPEMSIGDEMNVHPLNQKMARISNLAMIAFCSFDTGTPSEPFAAFCPVVPCRGGMQGAWEWDVAHPIEGAPCLAGSV